MCVVSEDRMCGNTLQKNMPEAGVTSGGGAASGTASLHMMQNSCMVLEKNAYLFHEYHPIPPTTILREWPTSRTYTPRTSLFCHVLIRVLPIETNVIQCRTHHLASESTHRYNGILYLISHVERFTSIVRLKYRWWADGQLDDSCMFPRCWCISHLGVRIT